MRRTSAVLLSATVLVLGSPSAATAADPGTEAACVVSTLPNPPDGTATVTAMAGNTTFYGTVEPGADTGSGVVWRDGAIVDTLAFEPTDANATGVIVGYRWDSETGWSQPVGQRPGEEPVNIGGSQYSVHEINSAGAYVGRGSAGYWPYYFAIAFYGHSDTWSVNILESSLDHPVTALAIDDDGLAVGRSDHDRDGVLTATVWNLKAGDTPRDLGPVDELDPADIDAGTVLVNRELHDDIALIDAATGARTVVPGSTGHHAYWLKNGTVLAAGPHGYALFRDGARIDLAPPTGSTVTAAHTLSADGTIVGGQARTSSGALLPTVWHCG